MLECTMKSKNSNEISFKMFFVVEIACMCNDDEWDIKRCITFHKPN